MTKLCNSHHDGFEFVGSLIVWQRGPKPSPVEPSKNTSRDRFPVRRGGVFPVAVKALQGKALW
jgi:hypothetical protein